MVDECHVLLDGNDQFRPKLRELGPILKDWCVQKMFDGNVAARGGGRIFPRGRVIGQPRTYVSVPDEEEEHCVQGRDSQRSGRPATGGGRQESMSDGAAADGASRRRQGYCIRRVDRPSRAISKGIRMRPLSCKNGHGGRQGEEIKGMERRRQIGRCNKRVRVGGGRAGRAIGGACRDAEAFAGLRAGECTRRARRGAKRGGCGLSQGKAGGAKKPGQSGRTSPEGEHDEEACDICIRRHWEAMVEEELAIKEEEEAGDNKAAVMEDIERKFESQM